MAKFFLGFDTSCYTTSLAVVDADGNVVHDERKLLPVATGEHGLRQSDGVFHHVRHLSEVWEGFSLPTEIAAVAVSAKPRPVADSYMPVFLVGLAVAAGIANSKDIPLYKFSHQEGHIAAGLPALQAKEPFLAVHISGGTTEVLRVTPRLHRAGFAIDLLSGTTDLSAGQMIDRVGVALGLPFPAGPHLEKLAMQATGQIRLPSVASAKGLSFSGPCSAALRLIEQGESPAEIACATLRVVANSLEKSLRRAADEQGLAQVLLVGGVMSNRLIRQRLEHRLAGRLQLHFAPRRLCTDNAVGIAHLARSQYLFNKEGG
ncbi:MAG: O-sialoglycoprotein endopeptidase [Firmicutes bacterium]|nr:O-sialoglycoprotein endopeptidase [Bacillota bacterium]